MLANGPVSNLIRENKMHQVGSIMQTGSKRGMRMMDDSLLQLVRSGNAFTGYYSLDGNLWIQVAPSQTVTMAPTLLGGLAVTAHNNTRLSSATFEQTSVRSTPAAPTGLTVTPINSTRAVAFRI